MAFLDITSVFIVTPAERKTMIAVETEDGSNCFFPSVRDAELFVRAKRFDGDMKAILKKLLPDADHASDDIPEPDAILNKLPSPS